MVSASFHVSIYLFLITAGTNVMVFDIYGNDIFASNI
jgi:hypothetical protein